MAMMRVADRNHPFYKPLWRRLLLVALVGAWAAYEIVVVRDSLWMILTGGMFVYAVWVFLVTWSKDREPEGGGETKE